MRLLRFRVHVYSAIRLFVIYDLVPKPGLPWRGVMPWVKAKNGETPTRAQIAGHTANGEPIYIARAWHRGGLTPGKLIVTMGCAAVSWGGVEYRKLEYEVLVDGPTKWVTTTGNIIPLNAYPGGISEKDEALFIGRVNYMESLTPGKVQPSQNLLFIPWEGTEQEFWGFEILCH